MLSIFFIAVMLSRIDVQEAREFSLTARQFTFDVSPSLFEVNQGDLVTITLTAGDDGVAGSGHGFGMEQYVPVPAEIHPGETVTIQFTADTAGTFTYFCTRVCGEGHVSMVGTFTVNPSSTQGPVITSFDPAGGPAEGGTEVTILGANFQSGAGVTFGSTPAAGVFVESATRIVATAPPHEPGEVPISVTNPGGLSATSTQLFTYEGPVLAVILVSPWSGTTAGGTELTIRGSGFKAGAAPTVGGLALQNVMVVNEGLLRGTTPLGPANFASRLERDVAVTNIDGTSARLANGFTWVVPPPSIASIVPATGSRNGGTAMTIRGAGFSTSVGLAVTFGGVAAANVQVLDAVTLTAVTPAHAAGKVDVTVTGTNGSATAAEAFTFGGPAGRRRSVRH